MRKILVLLTVSALMFAIAGIAAAGKVPTPTDPPEKVKIVSAEKARELVKKKQIRVFDMRKALNYGKGHLPGAVSLPYKWTKKGHPSQRTGKFDMSKLPSNKRTPVLFHSDGPNGWKSYYASMAAVKAGYKNVMWLREGFSRWKDRGYPIEH